jgi:phage regulator Rha-like protein
MSNSKSNALVFLSKDGKTPVTSSERIANLFKKDHRELLRLIKKHLSDFNKFGVVCFQNTLQKRGNRNGTQSKEIAILNEQHTYLLITFLRNMADVVDFKVALVAEFFRMKEELNKPSKDSITLSKQDYEIMKERLSDEVYEQAYNDGWNARNSTASLNWQEFNDLITVCQYNLDLKTQCLELMRDNRNIMNKLTEIKDNMNMLASGYIGTQSRVLDKLKTVKNAWLQKTQK